MFSSLISNIQGSLDEAAGLAAKAASRAATPTEEPAAQTGEEQPTRSAEPEKSDSPGVTSHDEPPLPQEELAANSNNTEEAEETAATATSASPPQDRREEQASAGPDNHIEMLSDDDWNDDSPDMQPSPPQEPQEVTTPAVAEVNQALDEEEHTMPGESAVEPAVAGNSEPTAASSPEDPPMDRVSVADADNSGETKVNGVSAAVNDERVTILEAQLERLQRAMAEETSRSEDLARENAQLSMQLSAREATLMEAASASDREQALILEGKQLADDLGKERMRSKQIGVDKKRLEQKVADLLKDLGDFATKEQQWHDTRTVHSANEEVLREELAMLQRTVAQQSTELTMTSSERDRLSDELQKLLQSNTDREQAAVSDLHKQLADTKAELVEAVEAVEAARQQLRITAIEADRKTVAAEREAADASDRMHAAEAKALEAMRAATDSTTTLNMELRVLQQQRDKLAEDAANAESSLRSINSKYDELVKQHRKEDVALQAKMEGQGKSMAELSTRAKKSQDETAEWKSRYQSIEKRLEEALATHAEMVMQTKRDEVRITHMSVELEELRALAALSESTERSVPKAAVSAETLDPSLDKQHAVSSLRNGGSAPLSSVESVGDVEKLMVPQNRASGRSPISDEGPSQTSTTFPVNTTTSASRAERELARLSAEVRTLRSARRERDQYQAKLMKLAKQHDVLLQMYGAQVEEMQNTAEDMADAKKVYKEQLSTLASTVESLQAERDDLVAQVTPMSTPGRHASSVHSSPAH